jgi:hypothetical protein
MRYIEGLKAGEVVELVHEGDVFSAKFVGLWIENGVYAEFIALDASGADKYAFDAYLYHGRWSAGSSATPIKLARSKR